MPSDYPKALFKFNAVARDNGLHSGGISPEEHTRCDSSASSTQKKHERKGKLKSAAMIAIVLYQR